jgi:tRNA threonylcarbamoyladenosine biosynthesis protein TsaB
VNTRTLTLAIDTSTLSTGLALAADEPLETLRFAPPLMAGARLVPAISEMLARHEATLADISLLVLAGGPGSFTGLRVGLSTAKGLAFGQKMDLVLLNTLNVLAAQAPLSKGTVVPVVESRRQEVYAAFYRRDGENLLPQGAAERFSYEALLERLPDDAMLIGPACKKLKLACMAQERHFHFAPDPAHTLSMEWLIQLGREQFRKSGSEDPMSLEPLYLQSFQPTRGKITRD